MTGGAGGSGRKRNAIRKAATTMPAAMAMTMALCAASQFGPPAFSPVARFVPQWMHSTASRSIWALQWGQGLTPARVGASCWTVNGGGLLSRGSTGEDVPQCGQSAWGSPLELS
jgi:hypothetical protein